MDDSTDKNGGPNFLRHWREYRGLTQAELASLVDTNQNMIGYLESGERGLSAKWLRKLAAVLKTTPGMILEHDPNDIEDDVIDMWAGGSQRLKKQFAQMARVLKSGSNA